MDCERIWEHLEAYAVDALEPAERAEVQLHLEACPECRKTADSLADLVALFPGALTAAAPMTPAEDVKERLLEAVSAQSVVAGERALAMNRNQPVQRTATTPVTSPAPRSLWRLAAYVTPVLLLFFSLAWGIRLAEALDRERNLKAEYIDLLDDVVGQQELVFEVVGFDDTNRQFLRAQQPDSTSYGKVFTRPTMPYVVVMAGRLPDAPPDATFHVWVTAGGQTSHLGSLTVDEQGFGLLVFTAEHPGPAYDTAFVTLQASDGTSPAGTEILRHDGSGST